MPTPPGMSPKDGNQVLRAVMDDTNNRLRVDAVISPDGHDLEIHYADDSIAIGDPTTDTIMTVNPDGSLNVDATLVGGSVGVSPEGLKTGLATSQVTVTSAPVKIPVSDLASRQTISVRVIGSNPVYFGNSAVSTSNGYPKFQYEEISMDIQNNVAVDLWAVCAAGQTCVIAVMEIA